MMSTGNDFNIGSPRCCRNFAFLGQTDKSYEQFVSGVREKFSLRARADVIGEICVCMYNC